MSAHLAPVPTSDLYTWRSGIESLSPLKPPCPGLYGEQWQKTHAGILDFLERFGAQAVELGWTDLDLLSVHAQHGTIRGDYCGALVPMPRPVEFIDADRVSFGLLTYYRTQVGNPHPRLRGVSIWAYKG